MSLHCFYSAAATNSKLDCFFKFLNNVSTGLFCSGYDNDRRKSSRSFVVLLTINATVTCLHAFSRALQLETGQVYLLQGVSLVHCLLLLLLAKVIRDSSLSMVSGGSQKSRGLLWWVGGGTSFEFYHCPRGIIWMIKIGAIRDATPPSFPPPLPPPPLPTIATQTMNNKFGIRMLLHEDRKQLP